MESGTLLAGLAAGEQVRVLAVEIGGPARELCGRHELSRAAAFFAAEGLVAAALLSAHVKGDERVSVIAKSVVPEFSFEADFNGDGTLRGRLTPKEVVRMRTFRGLLSVMKSIGPKVLYRGHSEVKSEMFQEALQRYLDTSQQADGWVRVHAEVDAEGVVTSAFGVLVERLPGLEREDFEARFAGPRASDFASLWAGLEQGKLGEDTVEILQRRELVFQCTCSMVKVIQTLRSMGPEEMRATAAEQGKAEVTCHYCNQVYIIDGEDLVAMAEEIEEARPAGEA